MSEHLTDRQFWLDYWENKNDLIQKIGPGNYFKALFDRVLTNSNHQTSLEIGGFPGYLSIFLKKYYQLTPTLLDYVIHRERIEELLTYNDLGIDDVTCNETDLFTAEPDQQYDLCLSLGFIEHFSDTRDLLERHVQFLKPGGTLLIIVPNFLGMNGWFNKTFDRPLYDKHYLDCMDKEHLKLVASSLALDKVETFYYGKFSIWLENYSSQKMLVKLFFKLSWTIGKILTKLLPFESRHFSPYTVLIAKKEQ
ncbi:MAG: class I SAM-dependent methyltransferase [Prolixibacteraceae bacterium]|nr:class I SAM-dependent methyltransferase [Prolixibacteraceae bacterium]